MIDINRSRGNELPMEASIRRHLAANPYRVVAGAFAVGFVFGGGLFTRLTGRVAKMALRAGLVTALPYLQEALLSTSGETRGAPGPESPEVDAQH